MRHQAAPYPVCCLARDISYLPFPSYLEDPRTAIAWRGAVSQSFLLTKLLQPAPWRTGHLLWAGMVYLSVPVSG